MPTLEVNIAPSHPTGLILKNPVIAASGTFGYGTEYASIYDVNRLGAIAAKAVTLQPRSGNPMPRIVEVPGGMLNAIGLQNVGVDALIREKAPLWAKWDVPVIANVAGASLEEYVTIAELLDGVPGIAALELNISCPNVAHGLDFGTEPDMAGALTQAVSERNSLPLIVKLTPNVTDIRPVAIAVAEAGAHALAIMNTLTGLAIDVEQKRPVLATTTGGLSGPAVRSIALRLVYAVAPLVDIPIIGIGGIGTTEDALMFLMAGATAVQIGTANFYNHRAPLKIIAGFQAYCEKEGLESIQDIVGAALPHQVEAIARSQREQALTT